MFSLTNARALCVFVFSLSVSSVTHAAFSQIVAFGDSLSDTGNVFAATGTPAAPYYDGNFSNGPVWVDQLAQILGVSQPAPSLTPVLPGPGGTNYAWGGARTTTTTAVPSTQTQVATYLVDAGGSADPGALYTILTGGNDLRAFATDASYGFPELFADGQAVALIADDLLQAGAQRILVVNVPDLGLAPISDGGNEFLATAGTSLFNDELADGLTTLGSPKVTLLDTFTVTQDIVANPGLYGLTNVDNSCLADTAGVGGPACDTYLFWDDLHPTEAGHALIAQAAAAAVVPVPAAVWLFGTALMGLVALKRRA